MPGTGALILLAFAALVVALLLVLLELTPSMKLKRRVISARYAALIDELYADEATARGEQGR